MRGGGICMTIIGVGILILFFYYITLLNAHLFSRSGRNKLYREFYECGFNVSPDIRINLDLQFAILCFIFIIYDMEIIILVPLLVNLHSLPLVSYIVVWGVIVILAISYYYEWEKYALQWGFN